MGDKFYTKYRHGANPQIPEADFANKRLRFATTLFYELLEKILLEEKRKLDDISVSKLKFTYFCLNVNMMMIIIIVVLAIVGKECILRISICLQFGYCNLFL